MSISIKQFTDAAQVAARNKGYLDIERVKVTDANGQAVLDAKGQEQTEERLVIKGTGLGERIKRFFGVRPPGADERVHNAFMKALTAEAGTYILDSLPPQELALVKGTGQPSARRRIQAAADLANRLVDEQKQRMDNLEEKQRKQAQQEAQQKTNALVRSYLVLDDPRDNLFKMVLERAHRELHKADPAHYPADKSFLKPEDLRNYPSREPFREPKLEDLSIFDDLFRQADRARMKADPKSPLSLEVVDSLVNDSLKSWITKIRPLHEALDRAGLPMVGPQGNADRLHSAARRLIAVSHDLGIAMSTEVFEQSIRGAPNCADHLRAMASPDPQEARKAILAFARQAAQGAAHQLDSQEGAPTFTAKSTDFILIPMALAIAREQGLDMGQLQRNLLDAPEVRTLLKGQMNFVDLDNSHGSHVSALANRTSQLLSTLLYEMDRGADGVITRGPTEDFIQDLLKADPVTGKANSEYNAEVDGPVLQQIIGFDLQKSEADLVRHNDSTVEQLFQTPDFLQELQDLIPKDSGAQLDLASIQPTLQRLATQHVNQRCSANGIGVERNVIRAADPAFARAESLQMIRDLLAQFVGPAGANQGPLVPAGTASIYAFTKPTLAVQREDGSNFRVPLAGLYAAGGAKRSAMARELEKDLEKSAQQGPLSGSADARSNEIARDLARGMIEIRPADGSPIVRPRKLPDQTVALQQPALLDAFEQGLNTLIGEPTRRANALRDLGTLCHQGLVGGLRAGALDEMPEQTLGFNPETATTQPFVLREDPERPGSILITWNQRSDDLPMVWINGAVVVPGAPGEVVSDPLPLTGRTDLAVRYTPHAEAGRAGHVEVLNYQVAVQFTATDQRLSVQEGGRDPAPINAQGQLS